MADVKCYYCEEEYNEDDTFTLAVYDENGNRKDVTVCAGCDTLCSTCERCNVTLHDRRDDVLYDGDTPYCQKCYDKLVENGTIIESDELVEDIEETFDFLAKAGQRLEQYDYAKLSQGELDRLTTLFQSRMAYLKHEYDRMVSCWRGIKSR